MMIFDLIGDEKLEFQLSDGGCLDFDLTSVTPKSYSGSYEFTPSEERQEIQTEEKYLSENIVINAIPENYGRIVWDGAYLKVY